MAYLTKKQQRELFLDEFLRVYVRRRQARGSTCGSAMCSGMLMLSALTNCGPLARPRWSATMTTVRRKTRPGDPAGGGLLPETGAVRDREKLAGYSGVRAGPVLIGIAVA